MTSRERILKTLRHEEPDHVPYDLSSTPVTGIHAVAYRRLRKALNLPERNPVIWHQMQQLAWVDDDMHEAMQTDAKGLRPKASSSWTFQTTQDADYIYYTDQWGITRRRQTDGGYYFDLCASPLDGAHTPADIEKYPFPDSTDEGRFVGLRDLAEQVQTDGRAFVLGGVCAGMLEMGQWLRGFDNFFCDLVDNRPLAEALCDKIIELKMSYWSQVLPLVGDLVDVIQEGDDYGAQNRLQISPKLWQEIFKPRLVQLISHIKKLAPHTFLFFHSCGSIYDIIPDLIEIGVDILNPVQVAATNMDSKQLKKEFGHELSFWGGGVDTQFVLPFGSPQQIREEVKKRIDDFASGGGFVFNTVHNIQADVPVENILAMRDALREFG